MKRALAAWTLATVASQALAVGTALAQDTGSTESQASTDNGGLTEIIVTATRRETNLQSTPVTVTAIGAEMISQTQAMRVSDLAAFVPNFSAATAANFNVASFAMRGVADNQVILYTQPPVGVIVDDFVVPRAETQLLDTFDLEQVEVLRGPQGTLFGKNTTGGAVVLKTKRPELGIFGVQVEGEVGDFGMIRAKGAINIPLGETLAFRGVVSYEKSDGYYRNGACYGPITGFVPNKFEGAAGCGDNSRLGGTDIVNGRAKLLWEPSSAFNALLQYEFARDRSDSVTGVNDTRDGLLFQTLGAGRSTSGRKDPLDNAGIGCRGNDVLLDTCRGNVVDIDGVYLNMNYDAGIGTFTSVSGWRREHARLPSTYANQAPVAPDGEVLSLFDSNREHVRKVFQQELRFASDLQGPFNFVAGAFFQKDTIDFCISENLGFLDLTQGPLPFGSWNNTPYMLCNAQKAKSTALFAEGNFDVTDKLTITAGFRYTWDDKKWYGRQMVFIPQLEGGFDPGITLNHPLDASVFKYPEGVVQIRDKTSKPTWRLGLSYQATDDIFAFFTYSRGFKSGGFNDQIGTFHPFVNGDGSDNDAAFQEAARPPKPETADSFELGLKTELLDRTLRFNVTGFYVKYKDLQRQMIVPLIVDGTEFQVTRYFNAAQADVKGVEVDLTYRPIRELTLRGSLGTMDAKYKKYVSPIPAGYDLATAPLDRTPKVTWSLGALYEQPVGDFKISVNGDVSYVARNLFAQSITSRDDNTFLNARTLVNAAITLSTDDDRYFVRLVGRNLTDKRYRTAALAVAGLWSNAQWGPPRYFGVQFGAKY